ncbi:MAG: pSer/pThr/pTyr-binding forkhead associated (FHA) protein, partial [Myxococcota bacterium]
MIDPNAGTRIVEAGSPHLILEGTEGPAKGEVVVLEGDGTLRVGRASGADLRITTDPAISRDHFTVRGRDGRYEIVDAGSANGTMLNDERVDRVARLRDGSRMQAGHCEFVVRIPSVGKKPPATNAAEHSRHSIRCQVCDRAVTYERATVLVDDDGQVLSQHPASGFICRACRSDDEATVHFPGYQTLEQVGEGNMGAIYRVRSAADGRTYALKCLRSDGTLADTDVERFLREAAALSQLKHRNIVGFVDQGYLEGEFFFVMDYVEGVDLDLYRRQAGGRVPPGRCVDMLGQVLEGLDHAHRHGFVHRDVKPANILVGVEAGRMTAKLTDFGLAKRYEDAAMNPITRGHISFGTPDYMPPEQITSFKDIGPQSDIYAAGAT